MQRDGRIDVVDVLGTLPDFNMSIIRGVYLKGRVWLSNGKFLEASDRLQLDNLKQFQGRARMDARMRGC